MKIKIYALYHGDIFIALGTKKFLADYIGVNEKTISFYATETYKKRKKYNFENSYLVIEVEDD